MLSRSFKKVQGIAGSDGIRIGKAFLYQPHDEMATYPEVVPQEQIEQEIEELSKAKKSSYEELDALIDQTRDKLGEEKASILGAQQAFLNDPSFYPKIESFIKELSYSASRAVKEVTEHFASTFDQMDNEYFKERATDIRDLGRRLLMHLLGTKGIQLSDIKEKVILIAKDLTPSDTVQIDKEYILGFATSLGGKTSHTAILARSIGVPAILGLGEEVKQIQHGDLLIIDGSTGWCYINPTSNLVDEYTQKLKEEQEQTKKILELANKPAVTIDNVQVELVANIGSPQEASMAKEYGAEGIGLYRTEFLFMQSKQMPTEEDQFLAYKSVAEEMEGKPVIIRTLDIGGDKELPYLPLAKELNPFLGYRAIRMCLDQQEIFITQLRAIVRASHYGKIKIMFPMISNLEEWRAAKSMVLQVQEDLAKEGISFDQSMELGIMIEIPSAAILASQFAKEVDFFSIGTNDLVQYTLAVDRMNEKVAYLYDYFHPAVLHLIKIVIDAAHQEGKWVGMCGGMAGDPLATPLLLGLGLDEWSMDIHSLNKVKKKISELTFEECKELATKILSLNTAEKVRAELEGIK